MTDVKHGAFAKRLSDLDAAVLAVLAPSTDSAPVSPRRADAVTVPSTVRVAVIAAVAAWLVLALWPPMIPRGLVAAAFAALLGWGFARRERWCLLLLVVEMGLKLAADAVYAGDNGAALTSVVLALDAVALVASLHPRSVRYTRGRRERYESATGDDVIDVDRSRDDVAAEPPDETAQFHLRWQPSNAEFNEVLKARRKLTNEVTAERIVGGLVAGFGVLAIIGGDIGFGVWLTIIGVAGATGLNHWLYRRLIVARRNRDIYDHEWDVTINSSGIVDISGGMRTETSWDFWKVCIVTPSALALLTRLKGRGVILMLARRGLSDGQDWQQFVEFVKTQIRAAHRTSDNRDDSRSPVS